MKYSKLGRSGIDVSRVCLGTMTWGYQNDEAEAHRQLDYALDQGVNFIDTAEMYAIPPSKDTFGKTEECIGTWFAKTGRRADVVLATKITGPGYPWVRGGSFLTGKSVAEALDGSLQRLQTDYVDVYQLHWPNRPFPHFGRKYAGMIDFAKQDAAAIEDNLLDILHGLDAAVKAGKIRHIGLSDDSAWGIMKYLQLADKHSLPRMQSIQHEFSLLCRADDPYVAEICAFENVAYLPWSPLATGMISGKYANGAIPDGARWGVERAKGKKLHRDTPLAHRAVAAYIDVANKYGLDVCQMALKFVDKQNFVTSTIIGATSLDYLKTNIAAFDIELPDEVMKDIDAVYRQHVMPY